MFEDMGKIFVKYWDLFLIEGLSATILLSLMTVVFGTVLGAVLALVKIGKVKVFKWIVSAVVEVIRGTPMLLQLYISTFLIPVIIPAMNQLENKKLVCISLTLILNSAAYVSEIIRSGIMAVDHGQMEAGRSLGLSYGTTMRSVVLPQAFKNVLPALGNEFIVLLKETSVCGYIALQDLTKGGDIIRSQTYDAFLPLIAVALIYLIVVVCLSQLLKKLENRLKKNER